MMTMSKFEEAYKAYRLAEMGIDILKEEYSKAEVKTYKKFWEAQASLRKVCTHTDKTHVDSWNYHNNVDDSYDKCNTCGMYL